MSYRAVQVYPHHFARDDAGIAGITSNNAVDTDFPLHNLIDDRQTTRMKFNASAADHYIDIDMGSAFTGKPDTLIIPVGHSLNGIACDLLGDTTPTPTTSRASFTPSGTGIIKETVTGTGAARRYWRLKFNTSGTHVLPGLILAVKGTFTAGFVMVGAPDFPQHSFIRFEQPSGISPTLKTGVDRRVMSLPFNHALDGADLTTMEDWIATDGMRHPFYIDPPSFSGTPDASDPAIAMKFAEDPESAWGTKVPNTESEKKSFTLDLIESVD